jgi:prevent-host-death family protein
MTDAMGGRSLCTTSSSYNRVMTVATSRIEVGVRDLKNNLSRYLDRVQQGEEVIVTDRGKPVARLSALDHPTDRLAELIAAGVVRPAKRTNRIAPNRRIQPKGSVSELVGEQRR